MTAGGEFDEAFAHHVVDDIVLPLLAGSAASPRAEPAAPSPKETNAEE
jgi:hypothetical protein